MFGKLHILQSFYKEEANLRSTRYLALIDRAAIYNTLKEATLIYRAQRFVLI